MTHSLGKEYLHRIQESLSNFEVAIIDREKFKPFESKVMRQQDVDSARSKIVNVIVDARYRGANEGADAAGRSTWPLLDQHTRGSGASPGRRVHQLRARPA